MKNDFDVIRDFLKQENKENEDEIFESFAVIWIDWGKYDEDIVEYFNKKLPDTAKITVEFVNNQKSYGNDIILKNGNKSLQIPYGEVMERDVTIKYVNEFIKPEYEIRWFMESLGSDTLAFSLLSNDEWKKLEAEFGSDFVKHCFSLVNLDIKMFDLSIDEVMKYMESYKKISNKK